MSHETNDGSTRAAPLRPGDNFATGAVDITERMRREMVSIGGFTHPLFTRPGEVSLPQGSPLPGQAVLLLMGGLVEQSGRLTDAIALMGMREVRFRRPVVPGDRMHVMVNVIAQSPHSPGRAICDMRWAAVSGTGRTHVEAEIQMLVATSRMDDADGR